MHCSVLPTILLSRTDDNSSSIGKPYLNEKIIEGSIIRKVDSYQSLPLNRIYLLFSSHERTCVGDCIFIFLGAKNW